MPVSRVYLLGGSADALVDRVKGHTVVEKLPWSVQCKAYRSTVQGNPAAAAAAEAAPGGGLGGAGGALATTVTLVTFSDSPAQQFAETSGTGSVLQATPQIESIMELVGGRYRIMRTVKLTGFKLGLGDLELKVGTVPASQRSDNEITLAELKYHPCQHVATCGEVLEAFAAALLPEGSIPATKFLEREDGDAAADPAAEFNDRELVQQYLAVLREKKAL